MEIVMYYKWATDNLTLMYAYVSEGHAMDSNLKRTTGTEFYDKYP